MQSYKPVKLLRQLAPNDSVTSGTELDLETLNRMHVEETYYRCKQKQN